MVDLYSTRTILHMCALIFVLSTSRQTLFWPDMLPQSPDLETPIRGDSSWRRSNTRHYRAANQTNTTIGCKSNKRVSIHAANNAWQKRGQKQSLPCTRTRKDLCVHCIYQRNQSLACTRTRKDLCTLIEMQTSEGC